MCELSWEMMISGVDGVLGQGPSFLTLPGPSAERHQWVGEGGSPPPCLKKKKQTTLPCTCDLPSPLGALGPTVQGGEERGGGEGRHPPLMQALGHPGEASFKGKKKKIHLDCTLLLFIAYFVLSVVDNSLLSYIKKYLNDVQYAMP